ncbi:MAG: hypothetical protein ACFCUJ_13780 [Thiotrichales bacterium]
MSEAHLWIGFLDAGAKSSPVILDRELDTGNPKTIYLFNQVREEFVEYQRSIVESKLRDPKPGEVDTEALRAAFNAARVGFIPNGLKIVETAEPASASSIIDDDSSFDEDFEALIEAREAATEESEEAWTDTETEDEDETEREGSYD